MMLKILIALTVGLGVTASADRQPDTLVRSGLEVFVNDVPRELRGKRVGLITNHSAIDRAKRPAVDLIAGHKDVKLVALLAPEHGIRGIAAAGEKILDDV